MLLLSVSQKTNHLISTLLYCIILGSSPPHLCKKIRTRRHGRIGSVAYMHLEIRQLKTMGNTPFGRFSAIKPQTPSPIILHQFVAA